MKKKVLVDADFFLNIAKLEKNGNTMKKILDTMGSIPVIHPYTAAHELAMDVTFQKLMQEGSIQKLTYSEILPSENERQLYAMYFEIFHAELRKYLEHEKPYKAIEELKIPDGFDVFNFHKAGMSLGDVHLILTAYFMEISLLLSNDGDTEFLEERAYRIFGTDEFRLKIKTVMDVFIDLAKTDQKEFTKDDLVNFVKGTGNAKKKSLVKQAWNETHAIDNGETYETKKSIH